MPGRVPYLDRLQEAAYLRPLPRIHPRPPLPPPSSTSLTSPIFLASSTFSTQGAEGAEQQAKVVAAAASEASLKASCTTLVNVYLFILFILTIRFFAIVVTCYCVCVLMVWCCIGWCGCLVRLLHLPLLTPLLWRCRCSALWDVRELLGPGWGDRGCICAPRGSAAYKGRLRRKVL